MNLAENIYRYRSAKNWSQTELAEALDVSRQSISKWENGTSVPELDKLIKMRELFGVTIDELVFDTPKEQKALQKFPLLVRKENVPFYRG